MSVKYKSIARKNPGDSSAPAKFYATAVSVGVTNLKDLAENLSDGSTTRMEDVYAVLIGLVREIKKELKAGRMVKLDDLGSFAIGVNSIGADSPEEVSANQIIRTKMVYRPGKDLKKMLNNIDWEKV